MKNKFLTQLNPDKARLFCFISPIICFLFFGFNAKADFWTQKADFPGASVRYPFTFSIGDKGYVGTGNTSGWVALNTLWEYDPSTNAWTQKADFGGTARWVACGFSIGNKGYAGLGTDASVITVFQDFWEYDPATNDWTQKANFGGAARYGAVSFAIDSFGYMATGGIGYVTYNDLWQYNPITDTWLQKSNLPGTSREEASGFAIGDNGYIVGGYDGNYFLPDLWEYNSITDTWTQKADCPGTARCDAAAFSICGKGYFGTGDPCFCIDFWEYDPVTDTWTQVADFGGTGRDEAAFLSIGNKGYVGVGAGGGYPNDFWEYTPDDVCNTLMLNFSSSDTDICEKFCINFFDSSQNNPTSWAWLFPGGNPSSSTDQNPANVCYNTPGIYDVTLITTNAGGSDTLTLSNYITVYTNPFAPVISQVGNTLTSTPATSYQWQLNSVDIPGATNQSYTISQSGLYTVIIGDGNGCTAQASVDATYVGIDEVEGVGIFVYPNPASDGLMVEFSYAQASENGFTISLFNAIGQEVFSSREKISSSNHKKEIDLHNMASGVYFIEVRYEDLSLKKKIIIIK